MNKKHSILLLLLFVMLPVFSQSERFKDIPTLVNAYAALKHNPSSVEKQTDFLKAFPKSWADFCSIYNHYDYRMRKYDRLYSEASEHILALKSLDKVETPVLVDALVGLTYGSCWDADAPNYLQEVLHTLMAKQTDAFFDTLLTRTKAEQMDFWAFYWSGLHENARYKKEVKELEARMQDRYPAVVQAMSLANEYYNGSVTLTQTASY